MKYLGFISLMTVMAFADFTLVYKMDNMINEIIEYKDADNVKLSYTIDDDDENLTDVGQYLINGRRYSVLREDGNLTYMDMDKTEEKTEELTEELNLTGVDCEANITKPFFEILQKKGEKIVASIKGEVWEVESEEDGEKYKEDIVVTSDKDLVDAVTRSFKILKKFGEGPYGREIGPDVESMMFVEKGFVLMQAEGIRYVKLDHKKIPEGTVRLPKNAVDSMKNLPKFTDEEREEGKKLLKEVLEEDMLDEDMVEGNESCVPDK